MNTFLADANLLIALTVSDHMHHDVAVGWFAHTEPDLATCPVTQGALLRFLMREGHSAPDAIAVLEGFSSRPWHRFWPGAIAYAADHLAGVIGYRQVTDAYLVALASHNGGRVASLDKGLASLHRDAVHLIRS